MALTLRNVKGSRLTFTELDGNFTYLQGLDVSGASYDIGTDILTLSLYNGGTITASIPTTIFTGNTSGSCINTLWVKNISGCTGPVTIGTSIQSPTSTVSGVYSVAYGYQTTASGNYAHAEGYKTTASGNQSHAQGNSTLASGNNSSARGFATSATTGGAHAEGRGTLASGSYSHAEGSGTTASGDFAHVIGSDNVASGNNSHAEGNQNTASGDNSHAQGYLTEATDFASHAEGWLTNATGQFSHAEGYNSTASGNGSHAEGNNTSASSGHAEGSGTISTGANGHAEGSATLADGWNSHAEGFATISPGDASHASGSYTKASGNYSYSGGVAPGQYGPLKYYIEAAGETSFMHFHKNILSATTGTFGDYSAILGGINQNINTGAHSSGIFVGSANTINTNVERSVILGGVNISGLTNDTVYVPTLNIDSTPSNDNTLTQILARHSDGTVKYRDSSSLGGGGGGTFTGNTSGTCIEDIWVTNIQSCSPLNINPGDEGRVYFGSSSGVTINVADERVGIGTAGVTNYKLWVKEVGTHCQAKIESDGGYARFIIDSQNTNDSLIQFNEAGARRWQIAADGSDDSLKILRQDITTGGTIYPAVIIDPTDNVGIGVDPSHKLDVKIDEESTGSAATTILNLSHDVGTDLDEQKLLIAFNFDDDNLNGIPQVKIGAEVGENGSGGSQIKEGSGAFVIYTASGNSETTNVITEKMRVDYAGNVGIGVTDPQALLHIKAKDGEYDAVMRLEADGDGGGGEDDNPRIEFAQDGGVLESSIGHNISGTAYDPNVLELANSVNTSGGMLFSTNNVNGFENAIGRMFISSAGDVGIGTQIPDELLHVSGATSTQIKVTGGLNAGLIIDGAENSFVEYKEDAARKWIVGNHQSDDHFKWSTGTTFNSDTVMQLSRSGGLTVNNFQMTSGATDGYVLTSDASGNASWEAASGGGATIDPYNNVGNTNEVYWDVSGTSTNYEITLTGNTILVMSNVRNGDYGTMIAHQDVTGSRTLTFSVGTNYVVNGGGGAPTLTATGGATDILSFTYNGTAFYWTVGNDYT